jgi:hypothetical protein
MHFIISQDIVATRSEFVVRYNNCFFVYLILNSMFKKFLKSVDIWLSYGQKYRGPIFLTHSVYAVAFTRIHIPACRTCMRIQGWACTFYN